MTSLTYDFENGTDGVKVDATDTPSSGDTAFASVTENTASGGVCKYDNDHAAHGAQALKIATVGSSVSAYVQWTTTGFGLTQWFRIYVYFTANPAANHDILQTRDSATRSRLRITTAGKVAVVNGSTVAATSSASIGLNQWVRIEYKLDISSSAGVLEAKLFNTPDSSTADETITASSLNTGTTETTNVRIGLPFAAANVGPLWLDDLEANNTGYPGPAATDATATPSTIAAVAGVGTVTVSTATNATPTPATVAAVAAVPAPTVTRTATVPASTVAAVAAVPAPTVTASSTPTPGTVAAVASVGAPTITRSATVPAAVVAAVAAVGAPTVSTGATVQPAAVAAVAAVPAPAVTASATVAPATVAAVAGVGVPVVQTGSSATAPVSTVAGVASVGAVTVTASATVPASTVAGVAAVGSPALTASATVPAATVAGVAAVGAPTVTASAVVPAASVDAVAAVGAPALTASSTVTPSTIAAVAGVGSPTVTTTGNATPTPSTIAAVAAVPAVVVIVTTVTPQPESRSSWYGLDVRAEDRLGRELERAAPRCPDCGEILDVDPRGGWVCAFDGWPHRAVAATVLRSRPPEAPPTECPNDGEPLFTGRDGRLVCVFDGWRPY